MRTHESMVRRSAALLTFTALVVAPVIASASGAGAAVVERAPVQASSGSNAALATLAVSTDNVSVRKDGKKKFKPATDGQGLRAGDTIKTDATGTAEIDYGNDAYTRLDVNTTFTIVVLTDDQGVRQVQGSLETGQTWNRTAALTESGSFQQEGAGANATVRGTAFAILCEALDHCTFTAVVDDIDLTGLDGVTRLLTPLDQCESTDSTGGPSTDLTGVLCGDITKISADDLPAWILTNLLQDLIQRGIDDSGFLTGTVVVSPTGAVTFVPAAAPGAPTDVQATRGAGSASVSFSPPSSNGGSPITSYTATATPSGGGGSGVSAALVATSVSASGPGSPIVVSPLLNGVPYTFTVTATNGAGTSLASSPSLPVTPAAVPGAPTGLNATPGYGSVSVSFTPPSDGGSLITQYTVTASPGGASTTGTGTPIIVSGLTNGQAYSFTVAATNAVGTGPGATTGSVTPDAAAPEFDAATLSVCYSTTQCVPSANVSSIAVEDELVAYFTAHVTDPQSLTLLLRFSVLPTAGTICAQTSGAMGTCSGGYAFGSTVANAVAVTSTATTFAVGTVFAYSPADNDDDFVDSVTDSFTIEAANSAGKTSTATVGVTVCENDSTYTCAVA